MFHSHTTITKEYISCLHFVGPCMLTTWNGMSCALLLGHFYNPLSTATQPVYVGQNPTSMFLFSIALCQVNLTLVVRGSKNSIDFSPGYRFSSICISLKWAGKLIGECETWEDNNKLDFFNKINCKRVLLCFGPECSQSIWRTWMYFSICYTSQRRWLWDQDAVKVLTPKHSQSRCLFTVALWTDE